MSFETQVVIVKKKLRGKAQSYVVNFSFSRHRKKYVGKKPQVIG